MMKPSRILIISCSFIILAILLAEFSDKISNKSRFALNVEEKLQSKKEQARLLFYRVEKEPEDLNGKLTEKANRENIIILRYLNNQLTFYSSNSIPIYD